MSSALSKKKSAPALLLRLSSPSDADDRFRPIRDQFTYLRNTRSAPSLTTITKSCQKYLEISEENSIREKKYPTALICAGAENKPIDAYDNEPGDNFIKTTAPANQEQLVDTPLPYFTIEEPLRDLRNFSNQPTLGSSISSSTRLLLPSADKPSLIPTSNDDPELIARSHRTSKRLSARCLRAFQKLRPHSVSSPNYSSSLNISGTNDSGAQSLTRRSVFSNPSISPQTSVILTIPKGDCMPPDRTEPHQNLELPENCVEILPSTSAYPKTPLDEPIAYNYTLPEQQPDGMNSQKASWGVTQNFYNTSLRGGGENSRCKLTDIAAAKACSKSTERSGNSFGDTGPKNHSPKEEVHDLAQRGHGNEIKTIPIEVQPIKDAERLLDWQEALNELEPSSPRFVYKKMNVDTRIPKPKDENRDYPEKVLEVEPQGETFKKSRLAAWKHRRFNSFSSSKIKLENQLEEIEKGAAITPRADFKPANLRKRSSLLFRLWNSVAPEKTTEGKRTQHQQPGDISMAINQQAPSHPLQPYYAAAVKSKNQEQALHKAEELSSCEIGKENTVTVGLSRKCENDNPQNLQLGDIVVNDTPRPDTAAGRRLEAENSRNEGKELEQKIGRGGIPTDDFPEPKRPRKRYPTLSSDALQITYPKPPALRPAKRVGVSWNRSIQEYAGSLGHVRHSGERPVSDTFRSGSSDFSGSGYTQAGVPTLSSLKNKIGFGEEPIFEESSLAADWDIAMRMMDEFSKEDHKLKRAGAIKLKRSKEGDGNTRRVTDAGKDGIGRSFSNGSSVGSDGNVHTRFDEPTLEEDNESEIGDDSSAGASLESLGYESTEEAKGTCKE